MEVRRVMLAITILAALWLAMEPSATLDRGARTTPTPETIAMRGLTTVPRRGPEGRSAVNTPSSDSPQVGHSAAGIATALVVPSGSGPAEAHAPPGSARGKRRTATPTPIATYVVSTHTPTSTSLASPTPSPSSAPTVTPTPTPGTTPRLWGLINDDGLHLEEEWDAGIRAKVVSLSWRDYMPAESLVNTEYVNRKLGEFAALRRHGFQLILSTGLHDVPAWVHTNYQNTRYVNQFGVAYNLEGMWDLGEANAVFNPRVRGLMETYMSRVFADFGGNLYAVRLGGGRYGELTFPPAKYGDTNNAYWAFDANAAAQSPTPGWLPGQPSPNGEAVKFLDWYLGALTDYQNWQIRTVRQYYAGRLMILYPSWGIRPGQVDAAVKVNLNGTTSAEINGEVQRGFDFARQVAALNDPLAVVTTTWLDADGSGDGGTDQRYWSPVKYLASLAKSHRLGLALYGENTGHGSTNQMQLSADQMSRFGLLGLAWFNERELFSGKYATLADYERIIVATR